MASSINKELELENPVQDIQHELILNFVRTADVIAAKGSLLFRRYGLTEAQFNVLFALKYKKSEWTQSDLGKRLVVTRASITSVLDKLEEKRLVKRNEVPGNRRIYHISLTQKGQCLIDKVEPVYRAVIHDALDIFTPAECRHMISKMERMRSQASQIE